MRPETASSIDGGPLSDPGVRSLAEVLPAAIRAGRSGAVVHISADGTESRTSYAELLDEASRVLGGLRRCGVRTGELVLLQLAEPRELLSAFWACVLGGFVPVPLTAGAGTGTGSGDREALGRPWILSDAHPETGRGRLPSVSELARGPAETGWYASDWNDLAVLVLTAGSTGTPKAVRLSHGNILSRSAGTAYANELTSASITVNWMPLDHVSGLVMFHVRDVFLGCTQIHARPEWVRADPLRWLDAIDRYRADTTWGPNSAFDLVNEHADEFDSRSWDLSCLRYIMNGGQAVRFRTVHRFLTGLARFGLPGTAMRPGWGMSETASGVVDHHFDVRQRHDGNGILPVGRPHPGVSVRVVDGNDRVVPEGTLGHLQVSGAPVTSGYHNDAELGRRSFTPDGWLRTGDLAVVVDGALTVTGSAADAITVAGRIYQSHEIEAVVEELPTVAKSFTVACGVRTGADGDEELAVFCSLVDTADPGEVSTRIRDLVETRFGIAVAHVVPLAKQDIPKTGTGKPKRAELRRLFLARATPTP